MRRISLALLLRLLVKYHPVLGAMSWIKMFNPLWQLVLSLGNFVPRPESHDRLGEVPGI
jgi:hypothetical protein